jgi:hypothetical protein
MQRRGFVDHSTQFVNADEQATPQADLIKNLTGPRRLGKNDHEDALPLGKTGREPQVAHERRRRALRRVAGGTPAASGPTFVQAAEYRLERERVALAYRKRQEAEPSLADRRVAGPVSLRPVARLGTVVRMPMRLGAGLRQRSGHESRLEFRSMIDTVVRDERRR